MNTDLNFKDNLEKIQNTLDKFALPQWDELPSIYLYMDQVIELTTSYFEGITSLLGEEKPLTAPMINNYIKLKVMPAPVKKRYGKIHLAYLFMISSLKQSMSISAMESVIPLLDDEEQIREMYNSFIKNQKEALRLLKAVTLPVIKGSQNKNEEPLDASLQIILASNFLKVFSAGITFSASKRDEEETKNSTKTKKESKKKPATESGEHKKADTKKSEQGSENVEN